MLTAQPHRCSLAVMRLYEQGADSAHIGDYVRRWRRWVRSGQDGYEFAIVTPSRPAGQNYPTSEQCRAQERKEGAKVGRFRDRFRGGDYIVVRGRVDWEKAIIDVEIN